MQRREILEECKGERYWKVLQMQKWTDNIKTIQDKNIKLGIVAADNQYAGFGRADKIFQEGSLK